MKILHLTLKKKWFDMIASGEKKEEYRDKKAYWCRRLVEGYSESEKAGKVFRSLSAKEFDLIIFKNGYSANAPEIQIENEGIELGSGRPEWGWREDCFVIKLGKILSIKNYNKQ